MLKSFKTEIDPTEEQKIKIHKTIGTCRYIYNFYLFHNKEDFFIIRVVSRDIRKKEDLM